MSEGTKTQVLEMSVGILVHNLIIFAICLIWFREFSVFLGILCGVLAAELLLISMARSTELCVESADEDYAKRKMMAHALFRSLAAVAAIALLWKFTNINILTMILGTLGLKTGAYLYPVVHKIRNRKADDEA